MGAIALRNVEKTYGHGTRAVKVIHGVDATIADGVQVTDSIIRNSIVGEEARVRQALLENSIVGSHAYVAGSFKRINIGDSSEIDFQS